jgi:hypothetical protein
MKNTNYIIGVIVFPNGYIVQNFKFNIYILHLILIFKKYKFVFFVEELKNKWQKK